MTIKTPVVLTDLFKWLTSFK